MAWTVPGGCYYAAHLQSEWTYYDENTTVATSHDPTANNSVFVLVDFANGYIYSSATNITIQLTNSDAFVIISSQAGMISPPQFYASIDCINVTKRIALDGAFSFGDGSGIMDASDFLQSGRKYDMQSSFYNRTDIVSVSIPEGVRLLVGTFNGCTSLTSVSQIPNGVESLIGAFTGCTSLTTAPTIPSGVRNVRRCFMGCSALVTASTIPASVVNAESCFEDCTSLTGSITIDASPTNITNMFAGTVQDVVLFGTGGLNETLVSEYANLYFWSLSATITAQREEQTPTTVDISVNVSRFSSGTLSSLNLYRDSNPTPLSVTWNDPTLTITGTSATFTTTLTSIGESDTFTLTVVATDSYGSSQANSVKIPISFYTMDVQAGGKEIAFGALANDDITNYPEGLFKCAMSFVNVNMVGEIKAYAGQTVPNGWLECDGSAISRADYPILFDAIGTLWGAGDGSTTFNLPNLNGRVPVGYDSTQTEFDTVGETGGANTVTLDTTMIPAHTHGNKSLTGYFTIRKHGTGGANEVVTRSGIVSSIGSSGSGTTTNGSSGSTSTSLNQVNFDASHEHTSVGGGGAHNNLQPYAVVKYIICAV